MKFVCIRLFFTNFLDFDFVMVRAVALMAL